MEKDQELEAAAARFAEAFNLVFDHDWEFSKAVLEDSQHYISSSGTFVNPGVEDESNNWGNRGSLFDAYRELVGVLKERNFQFVPFMSV